MLVLGATGGSANVSRLSDSIPFMSDIDGMKDCRFCATVLGVGVLTSGVVGFSLVAGVCGVVGDSLLF